MMTRELILLMHQSFAECNAGPQSLKANTTQSLIDTREENRGSYLASIR